MSILFDALIIFPEAIACFFKVHFYAYWDGIVHFFFKVELERDGSATKNTDRFSRRPRFSFWHPHGYS